MCDVNAYSEAIKEFRDRDPLEMTRKAGAEYDHEGRKILLKYLNEPVEVDFPIGEIRGGETLNLVKNDKVLILQYLTFSCGLHPKGTWVSFIQLPDGPHHHAPFVMEAITPLARDFGDRTELFKLAAAGFGGKEASLGDCGTIIPVFANLPLAVCLWEGDEEFAPNANILFDVTAPLHLTTAALWVLGVEVSRKLRGIVGQQYS